MTLSFPVFKCAASTEVDLSHKNPPLRPDGTTIWQFSPTIHLPLEFCPRLRVFRLPSTTCRRGFYFFFWTRFGYEFSIRLFAIFFPDSHPFQGILPPRSCVAFLSGPPGQQLPLGRFNICPAPCRLTYSLPLTPSPVISFMT